MGGGSIRRRAFTAALFLGLAAAAGTARADGPARRSGRRFDLASRFGAVGILTVDSAIMEPDTLVKQIGELERNRWVKSMVLRVDSPGGDVGAVQEIVEALHRFQASTNPPRPIVASFAGVAASGGYYIAAGANRIYANAGTLTGSIGVIIEFPVAEELMRKIGVRYVVIKSGQYKDTGNFARMMSPEELQMMQHTVDDVYAQFVAEVWKGRRDAVRAVVAKVDGVPLARVSDARALAYLKSFCDGRVLSGSQARRIGLVDELGGFERARQVAASLAGLPDDARLIAPHRRRERGGGWTDLIGGWLGLPPPEALLHRNRPSLEYLLR